MEFPAITFVIVCLVKAGRRNTLMLLYFVGGLCLILTFVVPM